MFKALLKSRLQGAFASMFTFGKAGKKRGPLKKALIALLVVYVVADIALVAGMLFNSLYSPFFDAGLSWLYFAIAALTAFFMSFISSIFLTQPMLFEPRDNELLLSLPVPPGLILLSRMTVLLIFTFVTQLLLLLPAAGVWFIYGPVSAKSILIFVLASLMLPLLSLSLASLAGWLLALVSSRIKRKTLVITLLSVTLLAAYFYAITQIESILGRLVENGAGIALAVRQTLFPAYHFGWAVAQTSWLSLLRFALCAFLPFLLVFALISRSYLHILTTKRGAARREYVNAPMNTRSPKSALLLKELRRFFSSSTYMLNGGMGLLFILAFPLVLLIKPDTLDSILAAFALTPDLVGAAAVLALCLMASLNMISAPSISLEGKSFWIIKSLPIAPKDILLIKAAAQLVLSVPVVVISSLLMILILRTSPLLSLMLFLLPLLLTVFNAFLGVTLNLRFPKLDWSHETEAIKQGASGVFTLLGGFLAVVAPTLIYIFFLRNIIGSIPVMAVTALLLAAAILLLYRHLTGRAQELFLSLGA